MKNGVIYFLVASLMFSYNSIGSFENYVEKEKIEYLLNERIEIMNNFLYGTKDEEDIQYLNEELNRIEAEQLLRNDLDILYKVIDNPTDYELALSVKVDKINEIKQNEEGLFINANLNWLMSGYEGEFNMIKNYDIKCVESDGKMYLATLHYIDKDIIY
ncbi:MAG: hypothetical protein PHE29_05260 [Tissierellia bacterium]|nr:hypothetical protein [Tissierellia bacterium]MDD4779730.1 hypothetical protein [Tissierellia bacterium]